jgi:hypothetical protein
MYHTQSSGEAYQITWHMKYLVSCLVKKDNILRLVRWECTSDVRISGGSVLVM